MIAPQNCGAALSFQKWSGLIQIGRIELGKVHQPVMIVNVT
jgi:hypothetical protein